MLKHPLEIKLRAIELLNKEWSVRSVADELSIPERTVSTWKSLAYKDGFIEKPRIIRGKKDKTYIKLFKEFNLLRKQLKEARVQLQILRKAKEYLSKSTIEKYVFIKKNKSSFTVSQMCKAFNIKGCNYYRWLIRPISKKEEYQRFMKSEVKRIFHEHKGRYGGARIAAEIKAAGYRMNPVTARLYMKGADLKVIGEKRYIITTNSKHFYPVAENKLIQHFKVSRYNEIWVSDITFVRMGGYRDWLFLTVIIDLFDRMIIGWSLSETMIAEDTIMIAFENAVRNRPLEEGHQLIFHSDRGVQYACNEFTSILKKNASIIQSMSRKKNLWDNAIAESFFSTIKLELINENVYKTKEQAEASIYDYIENYYNKIRRHSALNNKTITEFHEWVSNSQPD